MRKVIVFQHVAHEILGTLNPLLKQEGFRVKYVNFGRHPDTEPNLDRYNGLIVLGGPMGVYEADAHPHIRVELRAIEQALKMGVPILGICLGAQMLAKALGADVRKNEKKEIGWHDVRLTAAGGKDPILGHFRAVEKIFQWHGDTFDVPKSAVHLATSEACAGQAFRYGDKVYGLQFHLEVDLPMIHRWLKVPHNRREIERSDGLFSEEKILVDTEACVANSLALSQKTFKQFIETFGARERTELLGSGHGKPRRG